MQMTVPDVDGQVSFLGTLHLTRNRHGRPVNQGGVLVSEFRAARLIFFLGPAIVSESRGA